MDEQRHIEAAISALESQRASLGDATVDIAIGVLRARLKQIAERPREQRKLVTVLFGDVSGYTALAERTDPEMVTEAVNALWRSVDNTIASHGGVVDKHIGDAVMALFGAPIAREDDAERAVRAALDIQEKLKNVTSDVGWAEVELRMRIGIHTGPVHLATVGTTGEHTAMGDTVNLASRLESIASEGGVLVSQETWRQVRDAFEVVPRPPLRIKGKSRPVRVFEVRSARPIGWRDAAYEVAGVKTPLVGREHLIRSFERSLEEGIEWDRGRRWLIAGERGLGKSRLVDALSERALEAGQISVIMRARANRDVKKTPYALLRDLITFSFRILDSDTEGVALAKLESGVADLGASSPTETAHLIGHLTGFDLGGSAHIGSEGQDPVSLRDRAIAALLRFLDSVAERDPLLLVLENLHLADEGSLHIVKKLCEREQAVPLFLLMSSEANSSRIDSEWLGASKVQTITLDTLGDEDAEKLVRALLSENGTIDDLTVRRVVEAAGGHPYYIEELCRMLLERRSQDGEVFEDHSTSTAKLQVPPTLTALLQARLDALPEDIRTLLQRASVIGRVFWDSSLAALEPELQSDVLQELVERELIAESGRSSLDGLRQFYFRTSLLHEVTYETVLLRDRKNLHRHVARWLSEQAGDAAPVWASRIAEHWMLGGNSKAASAWYLKAAEQARKTSAFSEAETAYNRALEQMRDDPGSAPLRVSAHEGSHEVLLRQGKYEEARAASEAMLLVATEMNDEERQARAWWTLCRAQQAVSCLGEALKSAQRAVDLAARAKAFITVARSTIEKAMCLLRLGRLDEAAVVLDDASEVATHGGLKLEQALALRLQGAVQARLGRFRPAERYGERALELLRGLNDKVLTTACLLSLGELARVRGDLLRAAARYEEALKLARELGVSGHELVGMSNLGGTKVALGRVEEGEALLRSVIEKAPRDWYGLPETWRFLAEAKLAAGELDEAIEMGAHALSLCLRSKNADLIGPAWRLLGEASSKAGCSVKLEEGEHDARACFEKSKSVLAEASLHPEEARTMRAWARHELAVGDHELGEKLWQQAHQRFELLDMDLELDAGAKGIS